MAYNFELGKPASSSEQLCIFRTSIIINNDLLNQIAKLIETARMSWLRAIRLVFPINFISLKRIHTL